MKSRKNRGFRAICRNGKYEIQDRQPRGPDYRMEWVTRFRGDTLEEAKQNMLEWEHECYVESHPEVIGYP